MTPHAAETAPTPGPVPTLNDRAGSLAALGWSGREAEWLALVALQSGVFTRSQCGAYFEAGDDRKRIGRFVHALLDHKLAVEDERAIFPGGARAVLLTGKALYRALGIPNVRHRRDKDATTLVLMRRVLSLDYLIERPTLGWLPTEEDKVQQFEALGLDRRAFPYRKHGTAWPRQIPRYFAFKLPIAVDERAATFVYVDAGQTTDSELRAWGVAHAPLCAAPVLTRRTQDGDGQGVADPDGPTHADPDIRQEIARLKTALTTGNRQMLREWGTFEKAADRILSLDALPAGTPTRTTARGHQPLHHLAHRSTDDPRGGDLMLRPVSGPLRGRAQGRPQGSENGTRKQGGVYQKEKGGCTTPPSMFPPALFGFVVLDRMTRTAPAVRERTGATPPFSPLARFGEGGCLTRCTTGCTTPPRRRGGRSRPMYPCRKAPLPARGQGDETHRAAR